MMATWNEMEKICELLKGYSPALLNSVYAEMPFDDGVNFALILKKKHNIDICP
jgi:hypothetical protein